MSYIVTHQNPDMDAIASVWLLQRFGGLEEVEVKFVNTGSPDLAILAEATAVADTGKEIDPNRLRFDHHQLAGQAANDTCAAMQIFEFLISQNPTIEYLRPLVNLIFAGDTGRPEANQSRELGIHALLSGHKDFFAERKQRAGDNDILDFGLMLLDTLALRQRNQATAQAKLAERVVYKSSDGLIWAIKHGSAGSSFAAFDQGARIVVFEGEPIEVEGGITYPIGLMRAGEWQEPDCGELVEVILADTPTGTAMASELVRWFRHPAGFFSGRGTAKAPVFEPVTIDSADLARRIDFYWER
jgi:hypothetical protein